MQFLRFLGHNRRGWKPQSCMNVTVFENLVWASSFVINACLLFVLVAKRRWRAFRFFTAWIAFQVLLTITLFAIYRGGSAQLYRDVYWLTGILDFFLQISVVIEMAEIVLRPTGTWIRDARKRFVLFATGGTLVAVIATFVLHPSVHTSLEVWEMRADLFTSMMFVEIFLAMMGSANRLGLQWGTHVMGLGQGLLAWATVAVVVDALHNLLGRYQWYYSLEELRSVIWIAAGVYWIVIFWRPEKERLPLSPEMQKYLVALHSRVEYDLSRAERSSSRLQR
jgi:hypothetical protein